MRRALGILAGSHIYGPTPVDEAIPWLEAHTEAVDDHSFFLEGRAMLEAARGELERARALQRAAETRRLELGVPAVNSTGPRWEVAMLTAQFEEAAALAAAHVAAAHPADPDVPQLDAVAGRRRLRSGDHVTGHDHRRHGGGGRGAQERAAVHAGPRSPRQVRHRSSQSDAGVWLDPRRRR